MNRQAICALGVALALATSAQAQTEPNLELTPLVPPKAPWLKKNQKKQRPKQAKKSKKGQQPVDLSPAAPFVAAPPSLPLPELVKPEPPAVAQPKPTELELPLPPLVPLGPPAAPLAVASLGVLFQNEDGLPPAAAAQVAAGLRGVVKIAPLTRSGPVLASPNQPCADDACLAGLGVAQKLDQLLVATYSGGNLRVRLLDVAQKRQISAAEQKSIAPDEAVAQAEVLACKLLVPAGCTGEVAVDAADGVQLELDGAPLASGEKRKVPVGVHQLKAKAGAQAAQRTVMVSREGAPDLYARQVNGEPRILTAAEMKPRQAPPAAVAMAQAAPGPQGTRWTKPAGIAVLAVGGAVAVTGAIFGAKSKSDLDKAESAFRQNGGAFRAGDLDALSSGNSAAKSANALFIASGALLAAGALLTFAF